MPSSSAIDAIAFAQVGSLRERDFQRLARFIEGHAGIKMPASKKTMLEGRLRKRVAAAGCSSFAEYVHFLFERGGLAQESLPLIDLVTTNKTEFFREPEHFRVLVDMALPELAPWNRRGGQSALRVWSAAASIGAEAYTLAMVLAEAMERYGEFGFNILGTDISTRVLQTAALGIYPAELATPIPAALRKRHLLRGRRAERDQALIRVAPELRSRVRFRQLNLMEPDYPGVERDMDVIFLRNVLIYFDKPTQLAVLERLCRHLVPGGFLFLGHSETISDHLLPLEPAAPTVFRRRPGAVR